MKCPLCQESDLVMSDRQGIEIDYCPKCRGVWLDRGELDKLIERAAAAQAVPQAPQMQPQQPPPQQPPHQPPHQPYYAPGAYRDDDHYRRGYKRKKGFLGEIFDFD